MGKSKAIKGKVVVIPKNMNELEQFVGLIHRAEKIIEGIESEKNRKITEMEEKIIQLKKEAQEQSSGHLTEIETLARGVCIYAEVHRPELTKEERTKTFEFVSGDKLRWYLTPFYVQVEGTEEEAIAEIESRGLKDFIRIKREINKEAILADREKAKKIKSISISQDEIFAIVLADMGIELQKGERKFKKVAV